MTPQEEAAARASWAERKREKSRARIAKMLARKRERDAFNSIPASKRTWCVNTSRWVAR